MAEFEKKYLGRFHTDGDPAKKCPRSTVRDHEFYFTKRFTCPTCGQYLASYDFGRAGMAEGLSRAERINCPKCEQRIDWSGVSWPEPIKTAPSVAGVTPEEVAKFVESTGVPCIDLHPIGIDIDTRTTFGGSVAAQEPAEDKEYSLVQFVKDVQKACGASVDGVAGPETLSKTVTLSARKNRKHAAVKPVQKRLAALGYTIVGKADGIAGPKFEAAVIEYQRANKCWVDGEITAANKTWRKLLGME